MVFTTVVRLVRTPNQDAFWRKRKIFKMSAHFFGRSRNCYSLAIRAVHRALQYARKSKDHKKADMIALWTARITAGAEEHGVPYPLFREGLTRSNIMLDRKTLSDLAAWEPRTFKSLTQIAAAKVIDDEVVGSRHLEQPKYFFRRDLLKKFWNH
ncbi:hypothetical protein M8J76_015047 [Diaphorina citri]|nr:hypothetical protein M8J75_014008 [Diaphorina citri]KAI5737610.1 hypothetical protein M8J76_015047 [Diaphorina citri]KAI5743012.1 hypothetical protein M8J77_013636 [Diaphorina citri]